MSYVSGSLEGLPEPAKRRLQDMAQRKFFTSDLSVNEFLLAREAGFEPLGLVMGSSIYHIGIQLGKVFQNMELEVLTQAMYHARELAMTRMEEEADILGADGVIGVRLEVNRYVWGPEMAEFMAVGTAVKSRDGGSFKAPDGRPFTSDLSGQDFWTLLQTGFRPVSLAMGTCVYHVAHQGLMQSLKQIGRNLEMANYTQALYDARELALSRMQAEAEREGAIGIVGTQVKENSHGWDSHVIEYFAVGTGVVEANVDHQPPAPQLILPMSG